MSGPQARLLERDGAAPRLHLQHGPIDLIIGIDGFAVGSSDDDGRQHGFTAARMRFQTVLEELVAELPLLRRPASLQMPAAEGEIAARMIAAVKPLSGDRFLTPMAAVAGAVADAILAAILAAFDPSARPARAYVNNGGDIAVHLDRGASFEIKMAREDAVDLGHFRLTAPSPSRGIATSGRGGRSLSMGIADSVTIVATNAASADAAATLVANAVDLPGDPRIFRSRAIDVINDSDLVEQLVVIGCGRFDELAVAEALAHGVCEAERLMDAGQIEKAALFLQDQGRIVGPPLQSGDIENETFTRHG